MLVAINLANINGAKLVVDAPRSIEILVIPMPTFPEILKPTLLELPKPTILEIQKHTVPEVSMPTVAEIPKPAFLRSPTR
ncbi:hypothetical protein Tco_0380377, partial [Tanacetum coccineum]